MEKDKPNIIQFPAKLKWSDEVIAESKQKARAALESPLKRWWLDQQELKRKQRKDLDF